MNAPTTTIAPGTILAGKYRVAKVLGQGGMGVVVEAHHIQLDDRVALKFLLPEYATHPEASERFLREARAAVKIKSEHVARVSDVGTLDTGAPYMVMEYLEGSDLSSILVKNGPLPLQDAIDYLLQACEAINEAHGYGIVHRDIKPANLFVTKRPDGSALVKVLDFGISKTTGAGVDGLTRTTATMGSALYMSPEQMRQSRSVDHRSDIYSLGITLYELLAGKQPFYANTLPELCAEVLTGNPTPLRDVRGDLPPEFGPILEKSYARAVEQRCQTVTELVFSLAPFAPPRSQSTIDRFARLANVPPPIAGQAAAQPSGFVVKTQIGNYNPTVIPQSHRVSQAFLTGHNPNGGAAVPGPAPMMQAPPVGSSTSNTAMTTTVQKRSSGAAVAIIVMALFLLGGGGIGYWLYAKSKESTANAASSTTTQAAAPKETTAPTDTAATPASASTPPAKSAETPADSSSTSPSPQTSTSALASAEPSAAPGASNKPPKTPTAAPPPTVPSHPSTTTVPPHVPTSRPITM
ncbi:MAG: serine/threonine-protein kinase [Polyangiaceae bacterium]